MQTTGTATSCPQEQPPAAWSLGVWSQRPGFKLHFATFWDVPWSKTPHLAQSRFPHLWWRGGAAVPASRAVLGNKGD